MSVSSTRSATVTECLEDFLQLLRSEDLGFALRQLGLANSRTKAERVTRLLDFAEWGESQGTDGILDVLEALGPDDLTRVCRRLGIEPGEKAEMVERIDEQIEGIRRSRVADAAHQTADTGTPGTPESSGQRRGNLVGNRACSLCGEPVGVGARFCYRCGEGQTNGNTETSHARPPSEMWKRFLYPAIGVLLGYLASAISTLILSSLIVTISGSETINDMSEAWRALRSLITVSASIACMVIGFKMGSKLASAA